MNTVNYITPSDGDIYLVNNQTYVNSGGTDFDKIYNNITVDDSLENIFAGAAKEFGINEDEFKEKIDEIAELAVMLRLLLQHIMLAVVQYRSMEECLRMKKRLIISVRLMIY